MRTTESALSNLARVGLLASLALFAGGAAAEEEWEYAVAAYGWLPTIDVTEFNGNKVKISLSDILDNLDFTAMLTGEARRGKWSLVTDVTYLDLADKQNEALRRVGTLRKIEVQNWVVSPTVGYTLYQSEKQRIELVAGARYLNVDVDLKLDLNLPLIGGVKKISGSGDVWDGILGVRGRYQISEKWSVPYAFNGGAGDSDSTWQALASLAYRFERVEAVAGWRYLTWNFDDGAPLRDLTINGPFVGALFRF